MKELQPVFSRFGVQAISDVLSKELSGAGPGPKSAARSRRKRPGLQQANRTFELHHPSGSSETSYNLPTIRLEEGVVLIDGEIDIRDARASTSSRSSIGIATQMEAVPVIGVNI